MCGTPILNLQTSHFTADAEIRMVVLKMDVDNLFQFKPLILLNSKTGQKRLFWRFLDCFDQKTP